MEYITKFFEIVRTDYLPSILLLAVSTVLLLSANALLGKRITKLEALKMQDETKVRAGSLPLLRFVKRIAIPLLFLGILSISLRRISFAEEIQKVVHILFALVMTVIIVRSLNKGLELSFSKYFEKEYATHEQENNLRPLISFIKLLLWVVGFLVLLSNLGVNVSTALAGLGVGGIAVAIAAQGILGDLFSYFVIFFDRPFALGDFIVFDDKAGVVEKIGIKSSRIRVLSGEILIISNSDLTKSRIHNYKKMQRRRVVMSTTIPYETDLRKVEKVPSLIKEIIASVESAQEVVCDRSHFQTLGASALAFETVYYIPSSDYTLFMDVQQEINLKLLKTFAAEGIEFAYPTQKVFTVSS
ncbi:MAG: mechanosensitive ion channel family protein [Sphaerochaeta sp.]|jgi:small-conductance mechanosensitive channel|uniref:mechanosensitive ion channel family protein n=1 Tax=Sphaerochaeta sp. TaxID=1972642 RepID=UPI002FC6BDA2